MSMKTEILLHLENNPGAIISEISTSIGEKKSCVQARTYEMLHRGEVVLKKARGRCEYS